MIIYNTVMGVCAGTGLILVARLLRRIVDESDAATYDAEDWRAWAAVFGVLGFALAVSGGLMATTWPLHVNPPINIVFGEPSLLFGLLLLGASMYLRRNTDRPIHTSDLGPVRVTVFAVGLVLTSCTIAIARFQFIGAAPAAEPISGRLHDWPWIENSFFTLMYGLAAAGALLAPFAQLTHGGLSRVVRWCFTASGVMFLVFSAMNYYTHVGLLLNMNTGTLYQW